jgi:hypothetical protein
MDYTCRTQNPDELDFELERMTGVSFVDDPEEYLNLDGAVSFISNISKQRKRSKY